MALAMLGDVEFSVVESEEPSYTSQVAENPVESGVDVSDHVKPESIKFSISGMVNGTDAQEKYDLLVSYRDNAALLNYVGRNVFNNMVINSFAPKQDKDIADGFTFSIGLTQIRIAKQETVQLVGVKLQPVVSTKKNKGKQAVKKASVQKKNTKSSKSTKTTKSSKTKQSTPTLLEILTSKAGY